MWRFFGWLILLILSVWLGLIIARDPGYALFAYHHWTMEMPLWFAILALLIIYLLIYSFMRFFDNIDFSLYRLRNWMRLRRKYKAYNKTNRGLVELIEGHWRNAEHYLLEGVTQSDAPLINYLAAAKAAHEQGEFAKRDSLLRKAHQIAPQADLAIGLTQARLQFEQGQLEQALATLKRLRLLAPKNEFVLIWLKRIYIRLADWQSLLSLLPMLRKVKSIDNNLLDHLEINIYKELLTTSVNKNNHIAALREVWRTVPRKLQCHPDIVFVYVKQLLRFSDTTPEVEDLINRTVKNAYDSELVRLYGLLDVTDVKKQLAHAENWLKQYGSKAELLLTLSRISMRNLIWGKARTYLAESIKLQPTAEAYLEYAKLLERLGETNTAVENYRAGLMLAARER